MVKLQGTQQKAEGWLGGDILCYRLVAWGTTQHGNTTKRAQAMGMGFASPAGMQNHAPHEGEDWQHSYNNLTSGSKSRGSAAFDCWNQQ